MTPTQTLDAPVFCEITADRDEPIDRFHIMLEIGSYQTLKAHYAARSGSTTSSIGNRWNAVSRVTMRRMPCSSIVATIWASCI